MFGKRDLAVLLVLVAVAGLVAALTYWLLAPAGPQAVAGPSPLPPTSREQATAPATLTAAPTEDAVETQVASGVAATLTALPSATTSQPTQAPSRVPAADTPLPPTAVPAFTPIPADYYLAQEQAIGAYTFQLWAGSGTDTFEWDRIATLSAGGRILAQHEFVYDVGQPLGTDITGEGHPDVIIQVFTGGAHCCFSTIVYDLGPTLSKVLEAPLSNCGGRFEDLDGDGVMEYLTCDDLFAYRYCAYAASPMVDVVLQYEPGRGYLPASPRFPEIYAEELARHREWAATPEPEVFDEGTGMAKCAVLWPVLDYLYMGDPVQARAELDCYYTYPDKDLFWAEVVQAVSSSPLYTPGAPLPDVPQPDYYMLQLLTSCDPDWQWIGFLKEGQRACDPGVLTRDVLWLDIELERLGLLAQDELLEIMPEGCITDCRLDIVRWTDDKRVGSIRLDTTVGFPGEVYRTDGRESIHYRLRGDLTWEPVR